MMGVGSRRKGFGDFIAISYILRFFNAYLLTPFGYSPFRYSPLDIGVEINYVLSETLIETLGYRVSTFFSGDVYFIKILKYSANG
jgi:hypothetical protein